MWGSSWCDPVWPTGLQQTKTNKQKTVISPGFLTLRSFRFLRYATQTAILPLSRTPSVVQMLSSRVELLYKCQWGKGGWGGGQERCLPFLCLDKTLAELAAWTQSKVNSSRGAYNYCCGSRGSLEDYELEGWLTQQDNNSAKKWKRTAVRGGTLFPLSPHFYANSSTACLNVLKTGGLFVCSALAVYICWKESVPFVCEASAGLSKISRKGSQPSCHLCLRT